MPATLKDQINADLLAFFKEKKHAVVWARSGGVDAQVTFFVVRHWTKDFDMATTPIVAATRPQAEPTINRLRDLRAADELFARVPTCFVVTNVARGGAA
jgi:hypothetical protein